MVKKASIDRIFSQFKGMPIQDIALVQALYQNRDAKGIKAVFNKPKISDATALAYGRLSNQYINHLNNPSKNVIRHVKKKYGIDLTPNYKQNLVQMGNMGGKKVVRAPSVRQIVQLNPLNTVVKKPYGYLTIVDNPSAITSFMTDIDIPAKYVQILKNNGITNYRVYIKIRFSTGAEGWVSTSNLTIKDTGAIRVLSQDIDWFIQSRNYYKHDDIVDKVDGFLEVRVKWW